MLQYKHFQNREEWLKGRDDFKGIGASEASAIVGVSNWITATELWESKMGIRKLKDMSDS